MLIDGWGVDMLELVAAGLCLGVVLTRRHDRLIPLILGCGLLSWTLGDIVLTLQSVNGGNTPAISLPDVFYLGFYPLAYVGLVLVMRREVNHLVPATWLDGAIAGLGAAAICASVMFQHAILHSLGGQSLAVAVRLAYPVGDLLLLALIVGGTATFPGRPRARWLVLGLACLVIAIGDSFNLIQLASSHGAVGRVANGPLGTVANGVGWPTTILLISAAMWLDGRPANLLLSQRTPGFLLPGLAAAASLLILLFQPTALALGLALATLVCVGIRAGLSGSRLRRLTDESHRQSVTDHLTGLGNRRRLFTLLDAYFAARGDPGNRDRPLSFLFIDLDHFKEINDSFGHSAGDELLRQVGPRLAGALRSSDALVRVGGDELGVVITGAEPEYASAVAERLLAKLREPFNLGSVTVRISASIGVASAPGDASDSAGLLRCADLAMYRAKVNGTPSEVFRREIDDEGSRLRLVDELRVAITERQLQLEFQPQLDLRTGRISTVEALLRWPHQRLGMVSPPDFLPLAEEVGLMRRLTSAVLEMALTQCAAWRDEGRTLTVAVNISITNLLDETFLDEVRGGLAEHRLPASCLILEITETTIIQDFDGCKAAIERLRRLGLGISIDDFGAGFTSLAYLGVLDLTELKLDRTFIVGLAAGQGSDRALVRATIQLGHALGLRVVAEGIEDEPTLSLLTGMGCDMAQGFFISRPMPASALAGRAGFGSDLLELVAAC